MADFLSEDSTPAAPFVEGTHPGAYDAQGGFQGNPQAQPVPGETEGFKAPGGGARRSILDRITSVRPYRSEVVPDIAEWDGVSVEVRSLPLGERNDMMAEVMDGDGQLDVKALYPALLIAACYDPETGEKVFPADAAAIINGLDSGAVDKVAKVAMSISGMADKAKEDEAGKSSETETSVSPS